MNKLTDKEISERINVPRETFSRWKKQRPKLYERVKVSFECEAKLNELELSLYEALGLLENYKNSNAAAPSKE